MHGATIKIIFPLVFQQLHLTLAINSEKSDNGTVVPIILNEQNNNVLPAHPSTPNHVPYILLKTLKHQQNSPTMFFSFSFSFFLKSYKDYAQN
jgi:hypothetical protein